MEVALWLEVVDETRVAAQQRPILEARQRRPDRSGLNAQRLTMSSKS
jgi:hypothetical protein